MTRANPEARSSASQAAPAPAWRGLVAVLLLALAFRVAYLVEQPSFPYFHKPENDAWFYQQAAQRIASGDLLLGHEALRMSPGYFYFLGLVYRLFGDGPLAPRLLQVALGLGLCALVWDAARRLWGARWALLPGLVTALYGPSLYFEGHLLADSLAAFLHGLLVWQVVRALGAPVPAPVPAPAPVPVPVPVPVPAPVPRMGSWFVIGLCWGACAVVRPNALLLIVPVVAACVERCRGRRLGPALGALALAGTLAVAPVTLRNLAASGEAVLLTAHGGLNFYVGNGPGATGSFRVPRELPAAGGPAEQFAAFHARAEQALGRKLGAREADAYWYQRTWQAVRAAPLDWLGLMLRKLHLFWNARELHNVYDYEFMRELSVVLGLPLAQFGWLAPFGLVGSLWMLARRGALRFLGLFNLTFCAALVAVFVTDRYRLPVLASLALSACFCVRELWLAFEARRRRTLAVAATALILAGLVAWPVPVNKRYETKYELLGDAYRRSGQREHAEWAYRRSLAARPQHDASRLKLARLYLEAGARPLAIEQLRTLEREASAQGRAAAAERARAELQRIGAAHDAPPR